MRIEMLDNYITIAPNNFAITSRDSATPRHDPINDLIGAVTEAAWQTLNQPSITGWVLNKNQVSASKRRNKAEPRYMLVIDDSREVKHAAEWIRAVTGHADLLRIVKHVLRRREEIIGRLRRELAEGGRDAFLARYGRGHTQSTAWLVQMDPITPERARQIARRNGRGLLDEDGVDLEMEMEDVEE